MRSKLVKILFATVAAFVALCTQAATETVNGVEWKYTVTEEGTAVITAGGWYVPAIDQSTSGAVVVPSVLGGYPVTSIGRYAFWGCSGLTSVTIPNSVTNIGYSAFSRCGLTSVTMPNSVTSIEDCAFEGCSGLADVQGFVIVRGVLYDYFGEDGNIVIPDSVTSIDHGAFQGCSVVTSVTIPGSVTNIGSQAFYECSSLTSITISGSATSIGDWAFYGCSSLTSVTIPNSVTNIGDCAFCDCDGLADERGFVIIHGVLYYYCGENEVVIIPDDVTSIGDYAFEDCSGLTSIVIPNSVTSIGYSAFDGCKPTSVTVPGHDCGIDFSSVTNLVISDGVESIDESAFWGCSGLTSVTIPDSVTSIGEGAFGACRGLTSVTIPNSVTNIGYSAFWSCKSLESVTIPANVASIGDSAFEYSGLETVNFEGDRDQIEMDVYSAFAGTPWLLRGPANDNFTDAITLSGKAGSVEGTNIGASQEEFEFEDGLWLGASTVWWKWTAPSSSLMQFDTFGSEFDTMLGVYILDGGSLTEVAFNDDDEYEENEYCESRVRFNVNAGTTYYIGVSGYEDEQGDILLNWDSVPEFECSVSDGGVTIIEYNGSGSEVVIPATIEGKPVVSIGTEAFYECPSLRSVTIPSSVTNIGDYAFYNCENLTNVVWEGDVSSIEFGDDVFYGTQYEIIIPEQFELLIDEENVLIGFTGTCPANVVIPDGVVAIAGGAFAGWNNDIGNLESVTIPSSVTKIGNLAFNSCYNLSDVIFEGEMSSVDFGYAVFYGTPYNENSPFTLLINKDNVLDGFIGPCPVNLVIPDGVVAIAESAFDGWNNDTENLETVRIPISVTSIGNYAFYVCANLIYAKVPEALKSQVEEDNVFVGCSSDLQIEYYGAASLVEPVISPMNGTEFYGDSCTVTISCATEGASIYYIVCDTNNVTNPRPTDRYLYTGPFTVSATKMVRAFSMLDSKTSDVVSATFIKRELALPIAVDATNLVFTTGGDAQWTLVSDISAIIGDSFAQSGKLTWSEEDWKPSETWMETTVTGEGVFSFWWKVDCEDDQWGATWDRLMVFTNGVEAARIDGKTEWEQLTFSFNDISSHTIRWVFCKDDWDDEKLTDLAWVDGVVWTPASMDVAIDVGGGKNVIVPVSWIDQYDSIVTAVGGDKAAALMLTAANGRKVWECFMLGVDPTKADDDFKITRFWMENGKPKFEFSHSTDGAGNSFLSRLKIKGKARLSDGWTDVPPDGDSAYQFFTVEVSLP